MTTFKFVGFAFDRNNDEIKATFKAADDAKIEVSMLEPTMRQLMKDNGECEQGFFPIPELHKALHAIA